MSFTTIAKPYAQAIYDLCTGTAGSGNWLVILNMASILSKDDDIINLINHPTIDVATKKNILFELIDEMAVSDVSKHQVNFINLLVDNGRFFVLPYILNELKNLLNLKSKITILDVHTAYELSGDDIKQLEEDLEPSFGHNLKLNMNVDKNLLGGMIIKNKDKILDMSIKGKSERLAMSLLQH
jgi:F-type H+-transporting ATPase subunit delta